MLASKHAIAASRLGAATVIWRIQPVSMGRRRNARRRITPVSPMPPQVAANSSAFSCGEQRTTSPPAVSSSSQAMWRLMEPAPWWFLPCTSQAAMPPRVTNLVPGVTGGNQPRGAKVRTTSCSITPASAVSRPVAASKASMRSAPAMASTPPKFSAASP